MLSVNNDGVQQMVRSMYRMTQNIVFLYKNIDKHILYDKVVIQFLQ